jgi:dTDP-4-dehydrorhamnose 3,5-epimerase-like enzyme/dTDP-4-dehydrorhamnose reductase
MNLKFKDNRGELFFPFKKNSDFKQCTVSCNKKNVFRGIHINNFEKLVTCIQGKILDIVINFDSNSEDYLVPKYYELDPLTDNFQILVPKNYGHAFLSLEENSIIVYHLSGEYTDIDTHHIHFLDPSIRINLPVSKDQLIISDKDNIYHFVKPIDYIIFGSKGFLGSNIINILKEQNKNFITSDLRLNEVEKIKEILTIYSPKYVINCAGLTGVPNIFWCDQHKTETIETNITHQLTLAHICKELNIHLTIFGSAGIFNNDKIYNEDDNGNNFNNFYSECKIYLENIVKNYNNILYLRINYPISDKPSNKNLLTKLLNYKTIDPCEISITYIDNLFPILLQMIENNEIGICNFTNPGHINLAEIIKIYNLISSGSNNIQINKEFNVKETKRSLSRLETNKLNNYNPLNIDKSIEICIKNYITNNK